MPDFGSQWRRFGGRVLTVGLTWAALALVARLFGPMPALALALFPLGAAVLSVWKARRAGDWQTHAHQTRRGATALAMLMAGAVFFGTYWSLRHQFPPWVIAIELGMLLHYWLLTLA